MQNLITYATTYWLQVQDKSQISTEPRWRWLFLAAFFFFLTYQGVIGSHQLESSVVWLACKDVECNGIKEN